MIIGSCLFTAICLRVRWLLIKYINRVSPNHRILLTREAYSKFYLPVGVGSVLLLLAQHYHSDLVLNWSIAIGSVVWLIVNSVKFIKVNKIDSLRLKLLIIPMIYISIPFAFYGLVSGFFINILYGAAFHSRRYKGNRDLMNGRLR